MVHISQFYPCSRIKDACELYYACELGKYLKHYYNNSLSLDGIILDKVLASSDLFDYFRLAVSEGWVVNHTWESDITVSLDNPLVANTRVIRNVLFTTEDVVFDKEDFYKRKNDLIYDYSTPIKTQISFEEQTDHHWLWSIGGKDGKYFNTNNKSLCTSRTSKQGWLSLVAWVAVERLMTGSPKILLLQFGSHICQTKEALAYLLIMNDSLNCLKDWCFFNIDDSVPESEVRQISYTAWVKQGEDMGYHSRWYSGDEKLQWCKDNDLQVGDLVMLYERKMAQKIDNISQISGCRLARVDKLGKSGVTFTAINCLKTKAQGILDWENITMAVKSMYCGKKPYETLNTSVVNTDLGGVGFEHLLWTEKHFIMPLDKCNDYKDIAIAPKWIQRLNQNELVYWVLKEYGFEFNEERFLDKYFKNKVPAYTKFLNGELEPNLQA